MPAGRPHPPQPGENCPCCRAHFLSTCCRRPDDKDGRSSCRRPETWGNQEARMAARAQGVAGGLGAPVLSTGDGTTETAQRSTRLFHVCFPPICDGQAAPGSGVGGCGESSVLPFRGATSKQGAKLILTQAWLSHSRGNWPRHAPLWESFPTNRMNRLGLDQCFSNRWYNLMNSSQKNTHCIEILNKSHGPPLQRHPHRHPGSELA